VKGIPSIIERPAKKVETAVVEWSLMYTNLASLMAKIDDLILFVQLHKPVFLLITETFLSNSIPDSLVNLDGYTLYRTDRSDGKAGGSGGSSSIYIETNIVNEFKPKPITFRCSTSEVTILELASSTLSFTIACVYRPPSRALLQDDMILFHKQSELSATAANLFIAGDFNLPTIDWSSTDYLNIKNYADNSAAYHFVETLVNSSLCQIVSEPTRFRQNQNPSTLDLILINDPALVSQVDYLSPIGKSDHITLLSTIQLLVCEIPKKVTKLVKRVNYNKLKNDLESVQWTSDFFSSDNPNEMWKKFIIFLNTEQHPYEIYYV
jgi:hypothetical protein